MNHYGLPKNEYDYIAINRPLDLNFQDIYTAGKMSYSHSVTDEELEHNEDKPSCTFHDGTRIDGDIVILKKYYKNYEYKACLHPSVQNLFDRIGTRQRTITWATIRRTKITASQLGSVIADSSLKNHWAYRFRSKYRNKENLIKDKLRVSEINEQDNKFKNMILNHGIINESVAIRRAMKLYNLPVIHEINENGEIEALDFGLLEHPKYHFIAGSPDGVCMDGSLIEVKCPWSEKKRKNLISGMVPDMYYVQLQVLMDIMNLEQAYFINYSPPDSMNDEKCCISIVKRNKNFFNNFLLPLATNFHHNFMQMMKQGPPSSNLIDVKKNSLEDNKKSKQMKLHEEFKEQSYYSHPTFNKGQVLEMYIPRCAPLGTIHSFKIIESVDNFDITKYGCH